jgi:hypothetical protein
LGIIARMKLFLAFLVYGLMTLLLGAGIIMAIKGSLWLLGAAVVVYLFTFSKFGCLSH